MRFREQTAVEGLFFATVFNLASRVLLYLRHVVITAGIGLSSGLDAFYIAMSIMGIFIIVVADVFNTLGIPFLVRAYEGEGEAGFHRVSASIFRFSLLASLSLSVLMLLLSPFLPAIAAGFGPDKRDLVTRHLHLLLPMAVCYLPYHALGSFFRARRRFQMFYVAELITALLGLLVIVAYSRNHYIIPAAWSASYLGGAVFLLLAARKHFPSTGERSRTFPRDFLRTGLRLLPVYGVTYLYIITDRYFASFLPTGSVSALSYGLMLCLLLPGILNMENVFITPLSESGEKSEMVDWILKGILLFSVPVMAFTLFHALPIVRAVFERGQFDEASSVMTATALAYYTIALPCYLVVSIGSRIFIVAQKINTVILVSLAGVLLNVILNYVFAFRLGMGIKGIALATSLTNYAVAGSLLVAIDRLIPIRKAGYVSGTLLPAVLASLLALLATAAVPESANRLVDILIRGTLFVAAYAGILKVLPFRELKRIEHVALQAFFRRGEG